MKRRIPFVLLVSLILVSAATLATAAPVKVTLWSGIPGVGAEGIIRVQYGGTPIGKMVSAITGVDWTIDFTQAADYATAFNLRLAADDWPEAINMSAGMSVSQMNQLATRRGHQTAGQLLQERQVPEHRHGPPECHQLLDHAGWAHLQLPVRSLPG